MPKQYPHVPLPLFSIFYPLLKAALLLAVILVFTVSCRKTDQGLATTETLSETEATFFNSYRSADIKEKALVDFFKRRNDSSHFVEKAIERIGYPRWDKAISGKEATPGGRSASNDATITYIPFARENESHVNASLVVRTTSNDTSFHYLCDWQYSQFGYDTTATGWNARTVFVLFTKLDNATFGHTKFKITDDRLFAGDKVTATLLPAAPGNVMGRLVPNVQCTFYEMVTCVEHTGGRGEAMAVMFNPCYRWYKSFCTTVWTYEPDLPTSGGGGGGGNPPPVDVPPGCNGGPVEAARLIDPCGRGWEPVPVGDPPPPVITPCTTDSLAAKKMDSIYKNSNMGAVITGIPDLATGATEKGFALYRKRVMNGAAVSYTYRFSDMVTGSGSSVNIPYSYQYPVEACIAFLDTHPPKSYPAPSAMDIYELIRMKLEIPFLEGNYIAGADGSKYALTITDLGKATVFMNTKNDFLSGNDWNESSVIGKAFQKAYLDFREKYENDSNRRNFAYEMAMAVVLRQFDIGISLSKMDNAGNFKPLVVNTVVANPNKPNEKQYLQDCL